MWRIPRDREAQDQQQGGGWGRRRILISELDGIELGQWAIGNFPVLKRVNADGLPVSTKQFERYLQC